MAKPRRAADIRQPSFLELLERARTQAAPEIEEGSLALGTKLRAALALALKQCPRSRYEVAGRMGQLLGREISKAQLDAWTAVCESHEGHRFPAEYLPAFCEATGCRGPLVLLSEAAGMHCLPGPEALRAETQRLREQHRELSKQIRDRELFLKQIEGPRG